MAILLAVVLSGAALFAILPVANASNVVSISTSNGSSVCPASPLSGTWDGTSDTCAVSSTVSIDSSTTLEIGVGVTVAINGGISDGLVASGSINNYGILRVTSSGGPDVFGIYILGGSTVNNYGSITGSSTGSTYNSAGIISYGNINNYGVMKGTSISAGAMMEYYGVINNDGILNGTSTSSDPNYAYGIAIFDATIDNNGTVIGESPNNGMGIIISNGLGFINNYGSMIGVGGAVGAGVSNGGGIIYNFGSMTARSSDDGIDNSGTLNNLGTVAGFGGTTGIWNSGSPVRGVINNDGTLNGTSSNGGIMNMNVINDYCGAPINSMLGPYWQWATENDFACYTVNFGQTGLPSDAEWGLTTSWGPFSLPLYHDVTGANTTVNATGTLAYSYESPVTYPGTTYSCTSGCQGAPSVTGPTTISATFVSGSGITITETVTQIQTLMSTVTLPTTTTETITSPSTTTETQSTTSMSTVISPTTTTETSTETFTSPTTTTETSTQTETVTSPSTTTVTSMSPTTTTETQTTTQMSTTTATSMMTTATTATATITATQLSTTTATSTFTQLAPTGLSLQCSPSSVRTRGVTICTAKVTGPAGAPAGTVSFSSNGPGTFGRVDCDILGALTCVVRYTPTGTGVQTITARYPGNSYDSPSSGTFQITVAGRTLGASTSGTSEGGIPPAFWVAGFGAILSASIIAPSIPRLGRATGHRTGRPEPSL